MDLQEFLHVYDEPHKDHGEPWDFCLNCIIYGNLYAYALSEQDSLLGQILTIAAIGRLEPLGKEQALAGLKRILRGEPSPGEMYDDEA